MKAMILAAGLGTRLGEITRDNPKCLVEIHGKTLLEHAVDRLKEAGVNAVVINTHHFAPQVEEFVRHRNNFGISVSLSHEPTLLETGGGLLNARAHFAGESDFFVCNADVYHHLDLSGMLAEHRQKTPAATLMVMSRQTKRYLIFDSDRNLVGRVDGQGQAMLVKDSPVQDLFAFTGLQIGTPLLFDYIEGLPANFSIIEWYLKVVTLGGTVKGHLVDDEKWSDVGTPERLTALAQGQPF